LVALNMTIDPNMGSNEFEPIPPGKYKGQVIDVMVNQSENKPENSYLQVEWKLENGRTIRDYLNLWNTNPTAVQISTERLNKLGVALGMATIGDTDELMLKEANVVIGIQAKDQTRNEVLGYERVTAQQDFPEPVKPAPVQTGAPTPQAEPAPAGNVPPWGQ